MGFTYDLNQDYKNINTTNTKETLQIIFSELDNVLNGNYTPSERKSYIVNSHVRTFDEEIYNQRKNGANFRKEEWICKHAFYKETVGTFFDSIVDYQVPLKTPAGKDNQGMGKVDLLAKKGDVGYLLEVKVQDSTESPLRAIMEIFTYWKQLGGNNAKDFLDRSTLSGTTTLRKGIVLFPNEAKSSVFYKLCKDWGQGLNYKSFMEKLEVECFIAIPQKGDIFIENIIPMDSFLTTYKHD